jgi:hypothetical protein
MDVQRVPLRLGAAPAIEGSTQPAVVATPVSWVDGLLLPTIGALVAVGVVAGVHWLWPRLPPSTGAVLWVIVFTRTAIRWYTRPVQDRRFAAWCAGAMLVVLMCGLAVWFWRSPVLDDWRWPAIQTGVLWLTMLTFAGATHVRRGVAPANGFTP